ncbi:MATE family efflux transporter [Butyrivibrio sp. NC3005]|uniref:MATE family efflux transporter n=1 Tax=Butyrivibrio sp. NC3005 TaxID=1280685 RepID=UPI00040D31CC|nr:MATE family efflux transporter [Butyrivibrio sp. NC3005]
MNKPSIEIPLFQLDEKKKLIDITTVIMTVVNVSSIIFNTLVNNLIARVGTTDAMAAFSVFKMTKFIFLSFSEAIISPVRMIQSMLIEEKDKKMLREIFRYSLLKGMTYSVLLSTLLWVFAREMLKLMIHGLVCSNNYLHILLQEEKDEYKNKKAFNM